MRKQKNGARADAAEQDDAEKRHHSANHLDCHSRWSCFHGGCLPLQFSL